MLDFAKKYARNLFSQNGEDGIIAEVVRRLGLEKSVAVEVGANDGRWMSNTKALLDEGWGGVLVEADPELFKRCVKEWETRPDVSCVFLELKPELINFVVPASCQLLSTDTDGEDYKLFEALEVTPSIVVIEIDSGLPPTRYLFNVDGGAGYLPMLQLGLRKGYFLLCHTGNLIFVRSEYRNRFPEVVGDGQANHELYFNRGWLPT